MKIEINTGKLQMNNTIIYFENYEDNLNVKLVMLTQNVLPELKISWNLIQNIS